MKKIARIVIDILIVVFIVLFLLSLLYFMIGSLEMNPTEEQQDKIKIVTAFLMLFFGILSIGCIGIRVKLKRNRMG